MPLTNFDYIQSKSFNNNCNKKNGNIKYKTDNEKLKTEKKLGLDNLKDLRQLTRVVDTCAINISWLKKSNYNIYVFKTWLGQPKSKD